MVGIEAERKGPSMKYLIGTDIGTSGTKSIVMDTNGTLIASSLVEYGVMTLRSLWAEQWPEPWVDAVKRTIQRAVEKAGIAPQKIAGICVSGLYGGTGVPLDKYMRPVRPCIIWMDRRASDISRMVEQRIGFNRLYNITRNGIDPYYGYTKILWIKEHEPENWAKIRSFLPPNAYAIYRLTGEVAIDYSSAGNLGGIFDMERRTWSTELMDELGIPAFMMPQRIVDSSAVVGGLTAEAAAELGVPAGTPVCAGGVDCTVATLGLGVSKPGQHVAVIGTSMTWGFVHGGGETARELITMPYVKNATKLSFTFGGAATAGALTRWFRSTFAELEYQDELKGGKTAYACMDEAAAEVPVGSDGLLVLPYFMGERAPIWDVNARGVIFGLGLHHTKAHIFRAFLEAVAFSLRHSMEGAPRQNALNGELILAGGVAKSPLWRQIIADVTGFCVVCPKNDVEANLGDVILAAIGTNTVEDTAVEKWNVFDPPVQPDMARHQKYERHYREYLRLYDSLKPNMQAMASLMQEPELGGNEIGR